MLKKISLTCCKFFFNKIAQCTHGLKLHDVTCRPYNRNFANNVHYMESQSMHTNAITSSEKCVIRKHIVLCEFVSKSNYNFVFVRFIIVIKLH